MKKFLNFSFIVGFPLVNFLIVKSPNLNTWLQLGCITSAKSELVITLI